MGLNHVGVTTCDLLKITSFLIEDLEEVNQQPRLQEVWTFPILSSSEDI
jgi:hypothetical protein